jgi:hypothetical protein
MIKQKKGRKKIFKKMGELKSDSKSNNDASPFVHLLPI